MEAFSDMKTPAFVLDADVMRGELRRMAAADRPRTTGDRKTKSYYAQASRLLWIDRAGVDDQADSLLVWLRQVEAMGMAADSFYVSEIQRDISVFRKLDFKERKSASLVAARLEYLLTKACLRYAYGQRFGFVNPQYVFNHLDVEKEDESHRIIRYRGLFDHAMDLPPANYDSLLYAKITGKTLAAYLHEIQPRNKFYYQLKDSLGKTVDKDERLRIMANMERSRWRMHQPIPETGKHIVVNIPAFHLYAYGGDTLLHMRVVCGARDTKSPQLSSAVEWMEVNPQWVIPKSILEKDVVHHIGDSAYFARNKYKIFERTTNKPVTVADFSHSMLMSGNYRVAQESGSDNSLGRIVFRFKNKFQVFLHYTSNPGAFKRERRAFSHGCVRVEHPFDLAHFVLDNPDEWLLDRIRISMDLAPKTQRGINYLRAHRSDKEHKLIGYVPVKPVVPLHIIYYTLWPDEHNVLRTWPDVYGYDQVLMEHLRPFLHEK